MGEVYGAIHEHLEVAAFFGLGRAMQVHGTMAAKMLAHPERDGCAESFPVPCGPAVRIAEEGNALHVNPVYLGVMPTLNSPGFGMLSLDGEAASLVDLWATAFETTCGGPY